MKCKDITAKINLGTIPTGPYSRFRFSLHLILCKACRYYFDSTALLQRAMRKWVREKEKSVNLEKLNQELLQKFSKNHSAL